MTALAAERLAYRRSRARRSTLVALVSTAVFAAVAVASVAADGLWLARWGLGAAVGLWELLRIRKRKVLI